jgi:hypothetical protein
MKPLILGYITRRKGERECKHRYDYTLAMSVHLVNGEKQAVIDSDVKNVSMLTKTRVRSERDDDHYSLVELQTKTFIRQERDDESFNHFE